MGIERDIAWSIVIANGLETNPRAESLRNDIEKALAEKGALVHDETALRLAKHFLDLATFGGEKVKAIDNKTFSTTRNQSEIAEAIGATRSYVSTLVNRWKRDGLVIGYGRTLVVNIPKVKALLRED